MPFGRLPLRTKLVVFNIGMAVVTLAVLVGLDLAFERVRINGPLYRAIAGGQAVVADILPPPLYIVESHGPAAAPGGEDMAGLFQQSFSVAKPADQ